MSGPVLLGAKRITPSAFHAPPRASGASASSCAETPSMARVFSLPFAKNATERLSADQNGYLAPAVDSKRRCEPESKEYSHNPEPTSEVAAKTMLRPSGETASDA